MTTATDAPLHGLRVVETTNQRGAFAGRLLADLGADVLLVEPPGGVTSRTPPPGDEQDLPVAFLWRHANKRSTTADLSTADGVAALRRLLAEADVWLDGHTPAELDAYGLSPAALSAEFPELIVTTVSAFGHTGPYRDFPATDGVVEAMAGMMFKAGVAHKPPLLPPTPLATDIAGVIAAVSSLLAIEHKARNGNGQVVDVAVMSAAAATTDWSYPNASISRNMGSPYAEVRQGGGFLYPIFRCQDGWIRMIVLSPRQWQSLWDWLGQPEEWADPHWEQFINRLGVAELLCDTYEAFFADKNMLDICVEAQARGIVCTPLLTVPEVLRDSHFDARGTFIETDIAPNVRTVVPSGFYEINGTRYGPRQPAPVADASADPAFSMPRLELQSTEDDLAAATEAPGRPLAGVRVLDFGIGGVGVEAGRLLAEYGADVIKVESRVYPDFIRMVMGTETSPSFASSNRSKRSLGINLKTDRGRELMCELVRRSDVLIENSATGMLDGLGLGAEQCHELNPDLIMVSSQLLGSHGPNASWIGYGPSTQPYGGLLHLWDYADDDPPAANTTIFPDHLAGRLCALAAVAGLVGRRRGLRGGRWEVAQVEAVINMVGEHYVRETLQPGSAGPCGNRRPDGAPWGPFPCADEDAWCIITVEDDHQWAELRSEMGDPDWANASGYSTGAARCAAAAEIDARIAEWTRTRNADELAEALRSRGIPAGKMQNGAGLLDDPHLQARGWDEIAIDQPGVGPMSLEGPAFLASAMDLPYTAPAPGLGQHTDEIAGELLGLTESQIDALVEEGVLERDT